MAGVMSGVAQMRSIASVVYIKIHAHVAGRIMGVYFIGWNGVLVGLVTTTGARLEIMDLGQ